MNYEEQIIKQYQLEIIDIKNKMRLCKNNVELLSSLRSILSSTTFSLHLMTHYKRIRSHPTYFYDEEMVDYIFYKNLMNRGKNIHKMTAYQYRLLRYLLASIRKIDREVLLEKCRRNISIRNLAIKSGKSIGYIDYHLYHAINSCRSLAQAMPYSMLEKDSNEIMNQLRKDK